MGSLFYMQLFALKDVEGMVAVSGLRNVHVKKGGQDQHVEKVIAIICCL